jgi:outer membrane protein OmpA-like peptidoglycan-associated protein
MMVFLFVAVLFMSEVQKEQKAIKEIAEGYQNIQQQLYEDLKKEFKKDLEIWDAEILKDNTIRFKSPEILFDTNSSKIKELFKNVLETATNKNTIMRPAIISDILIHSLLACITFF